MAGKAKKSEAKKKYTFADYLKWTNEKRLEIIDGEIFDMGPAPGFTHQNISGAIFYQLYSYFENKPCKVLAAPFDVRFAKKSAKDKEIFNTVQPDISIICDESKIDEKGCLGAPDMIIEIVSPSSASRDHIYKRALYENHGVKEYWLVDPTNRITTIYRLNSKGLFGSPKVYDDQAKVSVKLFPELTIDFATIFPVKEKVVCENPPPDYL